MAVAFYRVNPLAGLLIIPYFAWGTLATALNYVIYRDNPQSSLEDKKEWKIKILRAQGMACWQTIERKKKERKKKYVVILA